MVMLYVPFLSHIRKNLTGEHKFMWKIYAASGNSSTYSRSRQSFVSSDFIMFYPSLSTGSTNEIHPLSKIFCYSWLGVYWVFGWEMHRLRKSNRKSSFLEISSPRTSPCWMRERVQKSVKAILALLGGFQGLHLDKLKLIWCLFVFFRFHDLSWSRALFMPSLCTRFYNNCIWENDLT